MRLGQFFRVLSMGIPPAALSSKFSNRSLYRVDHGLGASWFWIISRTVLSYYLPRFSSYSFIMILSTTAALAALSWLHVVSAQYYAITGVHDGVGKNGSRPARKNINTLKTDSYAWYVTISFSIISDIIRRVT